MTDLEKIILNYGNNWYETLIDENSSSVPLVTGDLLVDNFLHHMQTDYGIHITLEPSNLRKIDKISIEDQQLAMLFMLKWA